MSNYFKGVIPSSSFLLSHKEQEGREFDSHLLESIRIGMTGALADHEVSQRDAGFHEEPVLLVADHIGRVKAHTNYI